jgi:hypothetical protein
MGSALRPRTSATHMLCRGARVSHLFVWVHGQQAAWP